MLPASLMLLNTAHEYLGRRSWCCNSNGALLKFYVRSSTQRIPSPHGAEPVDSVVFLCTSVTFAPATPCPLLRDL